jgi:hypothetical protein
MNSLLSSLLRFDDNTMNNSILRLMAQYNRNQEMYNQNTEIMLSTLEYLLQHRADTTRTDVTRTDTTRTDATRTDATRTDTTRTDTTRTDTTSRTGNNEEQVYEFTLPTNISDMLLRALMPMDLSGQLLRQDTPAPMPDYDATTTYCYQLPADGEPLVCPISLEPIENNDVVTKINRCGHVFKHMYLQRWMLRDNRCPVCRGTI